MKKQIKINEFEQFFDEKALKKGISILKNDDLVLAEKDGKGEFNFIVKSFSIWVKREGNKIIEYRCSCGKEHCEHLCAVIFYFQKELFNETLLNQNNRTRKKNLLKSCRDLVRKKIYFKSQELKESIRQIDDLLKKKPVDFFLHLAVLAELSPLLKRTEYQKRTSEIFNKVKSRLQKMMRKELDSEQLTALNSVAIELVSARGLNKSLFSFLIPYVTLHVKDTKILKELKDDVTTRGSKYQYPGNLDQGRIALFHIELAEEELKEKTKRRKDTLLPPEFYIAKAERAVCLGKKKESLNLLIKGYEKIKNDKPANFISYLEYIIERAQELGETETELFFIKQVLIYDFRIDPLLTKRIAQLLDEKKRHELYGEIIEEIKKSHHDTFDKLSVLLLIEERYEDLVKEISRQQNKFRLLSEVAVKMLPHYNDTLFKVFVKQFHGSLNLSSDTHYQQKIFNEARKYIDKLPAERKVKLLKAITAGLGGRSYLRRLILKTYSV